MDLEVIAQLTVLTLIVVSGPLVIDRALDGSEIHVKYPLTIEVYNVTNQTHLYH